MSSETATSPTSTPGADSGKDLGVEIREYFIPDFTNWTDDDDFEKGFDRLLNDLKAEEMNTPKKPHEQ